VRRRTEIICHRCRARHTAVIAREGDQIVGRFTCGATEHSTILSHDAELYEDITARSHVALSDVDSRSPRALVNLIEITNTCNFKCPICYANSLPRRAPEHATVSELIARVAAAKRAGSKAVSLTGGEPTEHPRILELIAQAKKLGVRVNMPTNGYRLGQDPAFARRLKTAGLSKVSIQLDTLDADTHRAMRGNTFVAEKKQALDNARRAGLRLGIVATVSHLNFHELPRILEFAVQYSPALFTVSFQLAAPTGRFELPDGPPVDRERAIRQLTDSRVIPKLTTHCFWPLPLFRPWGMAVHPDCGVSAVLLPGRGKTTVLDSLLPVSALYRRLSRNRMGSNLATRNAIPFFYAMRDTPLSRLPKLLAHVRGLATGKGSHGVVILGVGSFVPEGFVDVARLNGCGTKFVTEEGPTSACERFTRQQFPQQSEAAG
jgi:pyruvate-formate lyase-activating enzyme